MRLDVFLFSRGFAKSRTEAQDYIKSGAVTVGGRTVTKPAFDIPDDADNVILISDDRRYASRGGLKLEAALSAFGIDPTGRMCLDIGASTGGFTDCLLKSGAKHVISVDSGHGQLAASLACDPRVTSVENCNARYLSPDKLFYTPELAVMDVSFISATYIIPNVMTVLAEHGDFICLIKPQFEVGPAGIGKGGIVRDAAVRASAVGRVLDFAAKCGFTVLGCIASPILGGDGNTEYLAYMRK